MSTPSVDAGLTIGEIIEALSPDIRDSLMPQATIVRLAKALGPSMPDYSKFLEPALATYAKAAMPQATIAKLVQESMPDYSKLLRNYPSV
ncbi:hypothetical protein C1J01_42210 [Nonomuraea aridisoli]|uniref:Uncharacterized protein n=1 Tax=Nonomuraea aridisoli TaxID=2070368 RepID=A0A2W2DN65_9ACTN|nr:hypothetical protein C1J01_42210 [Nonomuraea aridisoli]